MNSNIQTHLTWYRALEPSTSTGLAQTEEFLEDLLQTELHNLDTVQNLWQQYCDNRRQGIQQILDLLKTKKEEQKKK